MSDTKICRICRQEKEATMFSKKYDCKACDNEYHKRRVEKIREEYLKNPSAPKQCIKCKQMLIASQFTVGMNTCRNCNNNIIRERKAKKNPNYKDPKEILDAHTKTNIEEKEFVPIKPVPKKVLTPEQQARRERICQNKKEYYQKNKENWKIWHEKTRDRRNARIREKRKKDPLFAAVNSMRVRLANVLRYNKDTRFDRYLDCNKLELQNWLSYQFTLEMNWDNYAKVWHIDHVVPINFFDLSIESEKKACFHWTNLKPLEKEANGSKCDHIIPEYINSHLKCVKKYICDVLGYQTTYESMWWPRFELGYGKNPTDIESCEELLRRAIRSQNPTPVNDKGTDEVQRLNGDGSEKSSQLQ